MASPHIYTRAHHRNASRTYLRETLTKQPYPEEKIDLVFMGIPDEEITQLQLKWTGCSLVPTTSLSYWSWSIQNGHWQNVLTSERFWVWTKSAQQACSWIITASMGNFVNMLQIYKKRKKSKDEERGVKNGKILDFSTYRVYKNWSFSVFIFYHCTFGCMYFIQ